MNLSKKIITTAAGERLINSEEKISHTALREERFEIVLEGELFAVISMTPDQTEAFIYGYLYFLGMINSREDVLHYRLCDLNRYYIQLSEEIAARSRQIGGIFYYRQSLPILQWGDIIPVRSMDIYTPEEMMAVCNALENNGELQAVSSMGYYAAMVSREGKIQNICYDSSVMNALYKLKGSLGLEKPFEGIFATNAHPATRLLSRIYRAGIPVCLFNGIPTNSAAVMAKKAGITLISKDGRNDYIIYADSSRRIKK